MQPADHIPYIQIANEFGTPVYVYDGDRMRQQLARLRNAFSEIPIRIKYAAKALTNVQVLKVFREAGAGLDVVSIQEALIGLRAGFKPEEILFTPNCVSFEEIREAVSLGLQINIDNISILEQFAHAYEDKVPVCIRLNPHIQAGGNSNIQTGHIDSKFGISIHQLRHVQRIIQASRVRVHGLHVHTGSEFLDASAFTRGAEIVFDVAKNFPDLHFIDFGSGFKVAYRDGDVTTDVEALAAELIPAFKAFCEEYGRQLELWFEPGKFLVSESGVLLVRANVIKPTPATVFVGVDSGLNHLIRPMMYGSYHEIVNISNPEGTKRIYTVVGNICETDTFGSDRKISEVREGDILAILNGGAYGFSMASNYNSRLRPAEVLAENGSFRLIRRRETLEDLLATQL